MPVYTWAGRTREGNTKKGVIEAVSVAGVTQQLRAQGIVGAKVKLKPKDVSEYLTFLQPKVTVTDLVIFTRQFAVMIDGLGNATDQGVALPPPPRR